MWDARQNSVLVSYLLQNTLLEASMECPLAVGAHGTSRVLRD